MIELWHTHRRRLAADAEPAGAATGSCYCGILQGKIDMAEKLTEDQFFSLQAQFEYTPAPGDCFSPTGQHYILVNVLNRLGYHPGSKEEAFDLAQTLLAQGWIQ
jgi:hypothetical protein